MTTNEIASVKPKTYRCNGKCKCGRFMSRAYTFVSKISSQRDVLRDVETGAEVICYSVAVSKPGTGGMKIKRWQAPYTCACGTEITLYPVAGRVVADHECGAKCLNSKGHVCECSCGGENHGKSAS